MTDKLHEKALFCDAVRHDHLAVHNRVRVVADYRVLVCSTCKPLALTNQKVDTGLQLLVAQKVYLSVALLRRKSETEVSLHLADILASRGVDGTERARA